MSDAAAAGRGAKPGGLRPGRAIAAGLGLAVALSGAAAAQCRDDRADLRDDGAAARFSVEVAATPESRARGLMFREEMAPGHGMLFLFEPPQEVAFWMRNTPLPLDLLFVDATGTVIRVTPDAAPFSDATMPSGGPVRAVLEINAGLAARYGLGEGAELRHPAIDPQAAVWPCE